MSDVVKNDVVKKAAYDKLAAKLSNVDTIIFALKTKYQTDKRELKNKIPEFSSLATKTTSTAVENKIPDVRSLVKKKQTMRQKSVILKRNLLIIIMTNILLLQSLIL